MEIKFKVLLGEEVVGIKMRIDENIKATNCAPSSPLWAMPSLRRINEAILQRSHHSFYVQWVLPV